MPRSLLCAIVMLAAFEARADSFSLHGTVYGDGSPLAAATVTAYDGGTTTVAGSTTSDGAGHYALALPSGTYDLVVTPPSSSPVEQETVRGISLTEDLAYDVVLASNAQGVLHGAVRGGGNAPIPNAYVTLYTSNWQWVGQVTTDEAGQWTFNTGPGTFIAALSGGAAGGIAPANWNCYQYSISVSGSTTFDFRLPAIVLSGTVTGANDHAPIQGAGISDSGWSGWFGNAYCYSNASATSSSDGTYAMTALTGQQSLQVFPPANSVYSAISRQYWVSADTTLDFQLPSPSRFTGTVVGYGGKAVPSTWVTLYTSNWNWMGQRQTDAAGRFEFDVADGTYIVAYSGGEGTIAPQSYNCYEYNFQLAGNTDHTYQLPVYQVSGNIHDASGAPLNGAQYSFDGWTGWFSSDGVTSGYCYDSGGGTTAASGDYKLPMLAHYKTGVVRAPAGDYLGIKTQSFDFTADTVADWTLTTPYPLAGRVLGWRGKPTTNVSLTLYSSNWHWLYSTSTDANGQFSFATDVGSYILAFGGGGGPNAPQSFNCYNYGVNVTTDTSAVYDQRLPVVKLKESFTDQNGAPIQNVSIGDNVWSGWLDANRYFNGYCYANLGGASDANGRFEAFSTLGQNSFQFHPPAQSGFQSVSVPNAQVSSDLSQAIVLRKPDTTPPSIVAGPTVIHLSDDSVSINWTTNEAATSIVQYAGLELDDGKYVTNHSVTLTALTPGQAYTYRVGSTDRSKNGPTWSDTKSFTSEPPPGDVTPPVITVVPRATVDVGAALIQWKTDEPANGVLHWSVTGGALDQTVSSPVGEFTQLHSLSIAGLSASSTYDFYVESTDPDGNGPTQSRVYHFTTLAVPDTKPPKITAGPSVTAVTDSTITVSWTTDKPADSGISWNDGSFFDLANDPQLVTAHQMTITNLHAATTYSITVSTKDAKGNGPTLGGPITQTTQAAKDTQPPSYTTEPTTSRIGTTTAIISWVTDKGTNARIDFGTAQNDPSDFVVDLSFGLTHAVTITGLKPETTYFVYVTSTDASGNTGMGNELSFTTRKDAPFASCVGTQDAPVEVRSDAATCGTTLDDSNAGECLSGACSFDGHPSKTVAPGTYAVTVTATGTTGATDTCTSYVKVIDGTSPQLSCPAPTTVECTGAHTYSKPSASCSDACGCNAACDSGNYDLGGPWDVSCKATDDAGNSDTCTAQVTVVDTQPPSVACGAPVVAECDSPEGAQVTPPAALATDTCGLQSVTTYPAAKYTLGAHALTYTARDNAGNTASVTCNSAVTVRDTKAPSISCGSQVVAECTGNGGAQVTPPRAVASDACGLTSVTTYPAAVYTLGTTTLQYSATDVGGNTSSVSCAAVKVVDSLGPQMTCPAAQTVECSGKNVGHASGFVATGVDQCAGAMTPVDRSGDYPVAKRTNVTFTMQDPSGNSSSCTSSVTVVDTVPPALTVKPSPAVLWPPNKKMIPIALNTVATDTCDPAPAVRCTAVSNEPGTGDIAWNNGQLSLRSDRLGTGNGRTYTITCSATDFAGNTTRTVATVVVPHDQR